MKKQNEKTQELTELLRKSLEDANSITKKDKKDMKKLISDPTLLVEAMIKLNPDFSMPTSSFNDDSRTHEEIIADNYVALARFAIEKMQLQNVKHLKVKETDFGFIIYALTPTPVELDYRQFATSDYPDNKEMLLEIESLQADLFLEDSTEDLRLEVIKRIESTVL